MFSLNYFGNYKLILKYRNLVNDQNLKATIYRDIKVMGHKSSDLNKLMNCLCLCLWQGCDGSVLLNNTATIESEQDALPNANSIRGLDVVNNVKTAVESVSPATVSCADILAIAAEVASVLVHIYLKF